MKVEELLAKYDELAEMQRVNVLGSTEFGKASSQLTGISHNLARHLKLAVQALKASDEEFDTLEQIQEDSVERARYTGLREMIEDALKR